MSIFGKRKKGNRGNSGNQMNRAVVDKLIEITTTSETNFFIVYIYIVFLIRIFYNYFAD